MAFVNDLRIEDNSTAASATAQVTAMRLGRALRERYQSFIHKRECDPNQSDYDVKMASRALAAFTMFQLGGVDDREAGECVCDSSQDGGIDGVCINHNEKIVVIVQSKFNQSGGGTWVKNDFLSFKDACEKLQGERYGLFDEILQRKQSDLNVALSSLDYKFIFAMTHTGKRGAAEQILDDMKLWQSNLNDAALMPENAPNEELAFQVHLISAEDILQWLQANSRNSIDLPDVEIERYGVIDYPHKAYYGVVSGDQIADWWKIHGQRLFTKNIRNLLGKTDVNDEIKKTALSKPDMFWYYNNGITLLVNEVEPHRRNASLGSERGVFNFKDVSIINGAQTVSSIGTLVDSASDNLAKIKISARFIKVSEDQDDYIANSITRANNFQNRVLGRDFASQQPEQHRLARELILEGYQYQLLRTDEDVLQRNAKVIDLDEALNALACLTKNSTIVATLKLYRGRFFDNFEGSLYRTVFNPQIPGIRLINAVVHLRVIDDLIGKELGNIDRFINSRKHLIVTHANRYFSSVLLNSIPNMKNSTDQITPDLLNIKLKLVELINNTETYLNDNYQNAYPARFFANAKKIQELYENI
ncbi:hypothetical protein KU74_06150 [Pectobacterium brasiliense]|uniref:Abortive phage infection protein C-terminal domain-containing protein n=1 Tax=Pectobacterium brasiliense TaxID=180957 RepID=A0A0M2F6Y9_9GAMM|nr:AIPR family protein [Pectobacterium brasiliense]KGA36052.1 hypothetical protein KU74_06150 [Pectobacterium brasiliense]